MSCRNLVLEDRGACPAFVFFHMDEVCPVDPVEPVSVTVMDASTFEILSSDSPSLEEMCADGYHMAIEKRPEITACGVAGIDKSTLTGTTLKLPYGSQSDPVYRFSKTSILDGEEFHVPIKMTKEFSRVLVRFRSDDGEFPYTVIVSGNTSGLDISTGLPLEGAFRFSPVQIRPGEYLFSVPRQADYSLSLELWSAPGLKAESPEHVDDLLLWSALQKIKGFSWAMESLPDITVDIDYVKASLIALVSDWDVSSSTTYIL